MPDKISVRKDESGFYWVIQYPCCDTRPMRFHDWTLALRIANGHECPQPYPTTVFTRHKRLTRTIR